MPPSSSSLSSKNHSLLAQKIAKLRRMNPSSSSSSSSLTVHSDTTPSSSSTRVQSSHSSLYNTTIHSSSSHITSSSHMNHDNNTSKKKLPITIPSTPLKVMKFTNMVNVQSLESKIQNFNQNSHSSLDGKESPLAFTISQKKELKKQKHLQFMNELKEQSLDLKQTRQGDAFDIENNRYISRKNEIQKEMDQLTFEMKKFVYHQTHHKKDESSSSTTATLKTSLIQPHLIDDQSKLKIQRMMQEEYRLVGKDHDETKSSKPQYINYREFKDQKKHEKELERQETREMIRNGILDKKQIRKKRLMEQQRKQNESRKFNAKYGAPNEVGQAQMKSKYGKGGLVGKWKGGILHISRDDLSRLK